MTEDKKAGEGVVAEEQLSRKDVESIDQEQDTYRNGARWIQSLADEHAQFESPVDLYVTRTTPVKLLPLEWTNIETPPKKMKLTNTGYTLILSAKWYQERPYICGGPLLGNYVFSQLHFHWGKNDAEGSEHTVEGVKHPVEMHVILFKGSYLTQESAMKEKDGIVTLVYLFRLQGGKNPAFQLLMDQIHNVQQPHTSAKIEPVPLEEFVRKFHGDYFLYWGSVTTTVCSHYILWLITRVPVGVATEQVEELRSILDANEEPLLGNFREARPLGDRKVFHVNPGPSTYATLLALP